MLIKLDKELLDMTGLFLAKQVPCPAYIKVMAGKIETGTKTVKRLHDFKSL